jgi:hypothetical protein
MNSHFKKAGIKTAMKVLHERGGFVVLIERCCPGGRKSRGFYIGSFAIDSVSS